MANYRLFRHPDVATDILDIVDMIADYAGAAVALDKLERIEARIRALARTPHVGSLRDDIVPGLRAIPAARKGVIAFTVDDAQRAVFVVSVTYAGADWSRRARRRR